MNLSKKLKSIDKYPMHMPGHKRNRAFGITGADIDFTEIQGTDNLHNPEGIIADTQEMLKKIYKSKKSFLLINGSTVGILASVFALCSKHDKIIIAKNCHKSVYNACVLLELEVVFIEPEYDCTDGYYTRILQESVDKAIKENPDAKAVVITSPTYEGNLSSIKCSLPLLVDAAHGAHLGISYFPAYPVGDIVVSSLHKTLPSLTQTAVCNVYNEKYEKKIKFYLDVFQTSSPSYVLMNSVDICCDFVLRSKNEFDEYYSRLMDFRCRITLHALTLKYNDDPSKIVVSCANANINGSQLADKLRNEYKIEPEMASDKYIILMTSVADSKEIFDKLKDALEIIDSSLIGKFSPCTVANRKSNELWHAKYINDSVAENIDNSAGKICAEYVYAYPPDIPILMPNKPINQSDIKLIKQLINSSVNVISDSNMLPNKILTKRQ